jgi:hopene-associated glycosyltransferase HpnB
VLALAILAFAGLAGWLAVLVHPARPWDLRPIAEDEPEPPAPEAWPSVAVLVPARNEAAYLPGTLPALLAQDYPGARRVILVDDRSSDGTGAVARGLVGSDRAEVVVGAPLPEGWVGKVWALEQAARAAPSDVDYYLLTDADIRHAPASLARLVAEAELGDLALDSRMARLRCESGSERLLIPPFLLFFNLLYPMRFVNRGGRPAAAGGCVLVRRTALADAGGFEAIRDRVIDDISLARAVARSGGRLRLAVSRSGVASLRTHDLGGVWRMVRRTAFTELRGSWLLLLPTLALVLLLFPLPPLLVAMGIALAAWGDADPGTALLLVALPAAVAWAASAAVYRPTVRYFGLRTRHAATLPLAGLLYGGMTLDSACRGRRSGPSW